MEPLDYNAMAEKIQAEIEVLEIQQEDTERRIARLKQALLGLAPLAQESSRESSKDAFGIDIAAITAEIDAMSITDATRQILQASTKRLAPVEIKQQLINMGKDLSTQKNIMASIHSLLKRLRENDEIETTDNGLTYEWKGPRRFPRTGANNQADAIRRAKVGAGKMGGSYRGLTPPPAPGLTPPPGFKKE
jgi:hypothetical protein